MTGGGVCTRTLWTLKRSPRFGTQRKLVEHHGELWNSAQDGESGSGDIRRV